MENKENSNYLNARNIKPKRTKIFSGKLIWSLLERYCNRKKKKEELDIRLENIGFYKRINKEGMIGKSLNWFDEQLKLSWERKMIRKLEENS